MRSAVVLPLLAACIKFDGSDSMPANPDAPGSDGTIPDATIDTPSFDCTTQPGYVTITSGQPGHLYRLISIARDWVNQLNVACVPDGAYLAIPNDTVELSAIFNLGTGATLWVGVDDVQLEGTPRDVLGLDYTALGIAGNSQLDDCVQTLNGTSLEYDTCSTQAATVCECEP